MYQNIRKPNKVEPGVYIKTVKLRTKGVSNISVFSADYPENIDDESHLCIQYKASYPFNNSYRLLTQTRSYVNEAEHAHNPRTHTCTTTQN